MAEDVRGMLELKPGVQAGHDSIALRQNKGLVRPAGHHRRTGPGREVAGQAIQAAARPRTTRPT